MEFSIYDSPLSEDTKKVRRNLLISSCICIFISMTNELPSSFALWGAKFNLSQQLTVGWLLFSVTTYLFLHFFTAAGVEVARWIQPFYEGVVTKKKLLEHPAFDETDWIEFLRPENSQDKKEIEKATVSEAKIYVSKRLRYLYNLIYLQLTIEILLPIIIGLVGMYNLFMLVNNVQN